MGSPSGWSTGLAGWPFGNLSFFPKNILAVSSADKLVMLLLLETITTTSPRATEENVATAKISVNLIIVLKFNDVRTTKLTPRTESLQRQKINKTLTRIQFDWAARLSEIHSNCR